MIASTPTISPWFQYWQHKPWSRIRLFCFPYAGGGASLFRSWPEYTHPGIDICPVQLPGRENRLTDKPFSEMKQLICNMAPALLPYLDIPYAFFGHSMGALISFELARYLRQMKDRLAPIHIFISGCRAPHFPATDPPIYHLPKQAFIEELRRFKGTPEEILQNEELLQLVMPRLRADFALAQRYLYKDEKPLSSSITAFGGIQDDHVSHNALIAWRAQTSKAFRLEIFEGDHFFLHKEQVSLVQIISQELSQALQ